MATEESQCNPFPPALNTAPSAFPHPKPVFCLRGQSGRKQWGREGQKTFRSEYKIVRSKDNEVSYFQLIYFSEKKNKSSGQNETPYLPMVETAQINYFY